MKPIPPAEQKAWDAFLAQSLAIVHEVAPSTPISDIYAASYRLFQSEKYIIPHVTGNIPEDSIALVLPEKTVNEIAYLNHEKEMEVIKSPNPKIRQKKSNKKAQADAKKPKKLSTWNIFVKYYMKKMKDDETMSQKEKMKKIVDRWNKLTDQGKEHFQQKHGHDFDES